MIREAYRTNQHILSETSDKKFFIAYIYVGKDVLQFKEVESKLIKALLRLKTKYQESFRSNQSNVKEEKS